MLCVPSDSGGDGGAGSSSSPTSPSPSPPPARVPVWAEVLRPSRAPRRRVPGTPPPPPPPPPPSPSPPPPPRGVARQPRGGAARVPRPQRGGARAASRRAPLRDTLGVRENLLVDEVLFVEIDAVHLDVHGVFVDEPNLALHRRRQFFRGNVLGVFRGTSPPSSPSVASPPEGTMDPSSRIPPAHTERRAIAPSLASPRASSPGCSPRE